MRIIILLLFPPLLLLGLALALIWIPLPAPFPAALSQERNLFAAVLVGCLGMAYIAGLALTMFRAVRRAGWALDSLFLARGLTISGTTGLGRRYQGAIQGRWVTVAYVPPQMLQPALLNITVHADQNERAAIGRQRPLLDCRDCPPVAGQDYGLGHLQIRAQNHDWIHRLLDDPAISARVKDLVGDQRRDGGRQIYFQPGRLWLRVRSPSRPAEDAVHQLLKGCLALAAAAEQVE